MRDQLGRLGGTIYRLRDLTATIAGDPMIPRSLLNQLRRELVARLDEAAAAPPPRTMAAEPVLPALLAPIRRGARSASVTRLTRRPSARQPELSVLCRRTDQIEAAVALGIATIYADYQDIKEYAERRRRGPARGSGRSTWPRPGSRSRSRRTCSATWRSWAPTASSSATRGACTSAPSGRSRSSPTSR